MDESRSIRVVIVDDHAMVRESIRLALGRAPDLDVVGTAGSIDEARSLIEELRPDVALIDYALPTGTGTELAAELRALVPSVRVVIVTADEGVQAAAEAVAAGCAGFVRKSADLSELADGLRRVCDGEALFDADTLAAAVGWMKRTDRPPVDLTDREIEVLRHLAAGRTTVEISDRFVVSHHTARNHVRNILAKLGARSQLEAVVIAADLGIVEVGRS
jgi:DNA-binding NarL/FixJ family response regulator